MKELTYQQKPGLNQHDDDLSCYIKIDIRWVNMHFDYN